MDRSSLTQVGSHLDLLASLFPVKDPAKRSSRTTQRETLLDDITSPSAWEAVLTDEVCSPVLLIMHR